MLFFHDTERMFSEKFSQKSRSTTFSPNPLIYKLKEAKILVHDFWAKNGEKLLFSKNISPKPTSRCLNMDV